jgi:predicted nuclease of predicted toxin-antitoxin system
MRILLDENFPADFARLLVSQEVEVLTVHTLGWSGIKNGELLRRAREKCDVFVTLDRNLEFQQNIKVLPFGIVIVRSRSNRIADLAPHAANLLTAVMRVLAGQMETVG